MKFDLMSDIHLDFTYRINNFPMSIFFPSETQSDILLVAGDICTEICNPQQDLHLKFFNEAVKRYKKILCVLGNHDYWASTKTGSTLEDTAEKLSESLQKEYGSTIRILDNDIEDCGNVKVLGCTLWAHIPPEYTHYIHRGMNDYRYTSTKNGRMCVEDSNRENEESFKFISETVESSPNDKFVVLSHHAPSFLSGGSKRSYNRILTYAYCNEYGNWVTEHPNIATWCHGHVHEPKDYMINQTRVLANPCGYIGEISCERWFDRKNKCLEDWNVTTFEV